MEFTAKVSVSYSPSEPNSLFLPSILLRPDSSRNDQEAEEFYSQLQHTVDTALKKDVLFVIWDFNAIILHSNDGLEDVMGKFGHGRQNHRGEMLIDFYRDNELFITNTMFRHRERRKVTWRSSGGRTANMIDYILVGKRWKSSVLNTVSIAGGDFDSDHVLVMFELRSRIRKPQHLEKSLPRYRVDLLKNIETRNRYRTTLKQVVKNPTLEAPTAEEIDRLAKGSSDQSKVVKSLKLKGRDGELYLRRPKAQAIKVRLQKASFLPTNDVIN
ncbi:hypothetical protein QYM36_001335 [Artemia franciscana]|uniref:Endonuclease/exonuclease/phosphatase domain-containing protein n=1 Tax=Artemia franciscana TaxID=6661 RepID=A0AA88ICV4_ARTSF|nr:hypothetical protein QYM36_001335 [Artemia franciscana]